MLRLLLLGTFLMAVPHLHALSEAELQSIGRRVWQNECAGTREGLTSWNSGENFASLGIGHFIWYPKGVNGPFEESFPKLVQFLRQHGAKVPAWLAETPDCPWPTRAAFMADFKGPRLSELRTLLANTIHLQSQFLAERLEEALPKMRAAASATKRDHITAQFQRLRGTSAGTFALIDYVNFKGEGTKTTERYQGEGWGLLQVLEEMQSSGSGAAQEFSKAAARVLERRVRNAPAGRGEGRWLEGWKNRVRAYAG